jgi:hypothetical protein
MERLFKKYSIHLLSITIIVFATISFIVSSYYSSLTNITKDYSSINLNEVDNLMIVSHPTDEILFGGAHLLNDNYLVVCITCGVEKNLTLDFIEAIQKTKDQYLILGYPEYTGNERENWNIYSHAIKEDLSIIINLKEWNSIVTHNPEGEYGSIQHKYISKWTTELSRKDNLVYFGKYYTKKSIVNHYDEFSQLNKNNLNQKINILGIYKTEDYLQTEFSHIYNYEEWIKYNEWSK